MYTILLKKTFELFIEKKNILLKVLFLPAIVLTLLKYFYLTPYTNLLISFENLPFEFYIAFSISISINIFISIATHR
ncbi:hypothetical protein CRU99_13070, partial [Malaciobacter mytili]|uniref:hypothetical protein n=1 Tax=Malaciobacter mytili TaxID=603050 RepID=UPI001025E5DF